MCAAKHNYVKIAEWLLSHVANPELRAHDVSIFYFVLALQQKKPT